VARIALRYTIDKLRTGQGCKQDSFKIYKGYSQDRLRIDLEYIKDMARIL
jgi:hypothetical protein